MTKMFLCSGNTHFGSCCLISSTSLFTPAASWREHSWRAVNAPTECAGAGLLLPMDVPGSRAFSELGCFRLWFGLLSMASHVMLKDRLLLLSSQHSHASSVRAVSVVWWMPRGSAFLSKPLFLQESEIAELKLLNKPDWIQGSRSGSPLCLPQKCGEEKFLRVLQGIVWLVGERKASQGFLIPSLFFLPLKGLMDIIVFSYDLCF